MWDEKHSSDLSRRERQVIEIVMQHGRCSARDIEQALPDAPTYSAVRSVLRSLTDKGLLLKETIESRDWFVLPVSAKKARVKALHSLVHRFFDDSACEAAVALLGQKNVKLSPEEATRLINLIENARQP